MVSASANHPVLPLVAQYLDHVRFEKRLAERTLALYTLDLEKLAQHADQAGVDLTAVAHHHIRRWVAQMHSQGRSGRGIALILSGWRGFYRWLGQQGLVASNPVQDVRAPKSPKPLPKALGLDEAVGLADFDNTADDPWLEARDAAMVALLYGGGLRVGELTGLDAAPSASARGWLDLAAGEAHELRPQGQGAALSRALFLGRFGTRLTAASVWQRLRRRSQLAGMATPVHPHMLRHSFASHVLQSSGDLRAVQELLGHANISTTQVYTRLDFQHLAQTYDAAHPRAKLLPGK
jgi:integrase/recombinase XerC